MNALKKYLVLSLALTLLSACSFHLGNITAAPNGADFSYVGQATGQSSTFRLFGLGSINRDALVYDAKQALFNNRPLKPGEAYANFTVDFKFTIISFFTQTKVTVTADIIDYDAPPVDTVYGPIFLDKSKDEKPFLETVLQVGDTITDEGDNLHIVKGFTEKGVFVNELGRKTPRHEIVILSNVRFREEDKAKLLARAGQQAYFSPDENPLFSVMDTVFNEFAKEYIILDLQGDEALVLLQNSIEDYLILDYISLDRLYVRKDQYRGFKQGQVVNYAGEECTILFFGLERAIVADKYGRTAEKYKRLKPKN
jgi:hypothetical protein